jgi:prepilin-type N-terminal cleavage/methylation domain-containing protein
LKVHSSERGFTLLEVAVALTILAVAFTALSTIQARNISLTSEDREITQITLALRDVLAGIQTGEIPAENGTGVVGEDFPELAWRLSAEEAGVEGLLKMKVTVFREGSDPDDGESFWLLLGAREE